MVLPFFFSLKGRLKPYIDTKVTDLWIRNIVLKNNFKKDRKTIHFSYWDSKKVNLLILLKLSNNKKKLFNSNYFMHH